MIGIAIRALLFTLVVPGTIVTIGGPYLVLGCPHALHPHYALGYAVIAIGAAIYAWCTWNFIVTGRGTPAPEAPPRELVSVGLYRYSRNPMYVGVVTVLFGEALLLGSWHLVAYAACIVTAFHLRVLFYEEPNLRRLFGAAYGRYCAGVPRWIGVLR